MSFRASEPEGNKALGKISGSDKAGEKKMEVHKVKITNLSGLHHIQKARADPKRYLLDVCSLVQRFLSYFSEKHGDL